MNLNDNPIIEDLKVILRECDDNIAHHMLWVSSEGQVRIERIPEDMSPLEFIGTKKDAVLQYETFGRDNGYVGVNAANDVSFTESLYKSLLHEWPKAKDNIEAEYVDVY